MGYSLSQPYNASLPIGFDFGKGKSIDVGQGYAKLKLVLGANTDTSLYFLFTLKDAAGNIVNHVGPNSAVKDNWYKDEIGFVIDKGNAIRYNYNAALGVKNAVQFTQVGDSITVNIDFTGAYNGDYGSGTAKFNFDSTMLSEVLITVVNDHQNAKDGYNRYGLADAEVVFSKIVVGDINFTPLDLKDETLFAAKGFMVYPNPTKEGTVHFNINAENVKVVDLLGNVVFSAASASEVNTASFNKGIYVVNSSKGTTRFVVE